MNDLYCKNIALQLYSIRDSAEKNLYETLKEVKSYGYNGVEFAGLYGNDPEAVAKMLSDIGLRPLSAHVSLAELREDIEKVVSDYTAVGCRHIAVPWLSENDRPGGAGFEKTVEDIARFGEVFAKNGITLSYHNHDFEFVRDESGVYALDKLYSEIPEDILKTELDVCWVSVAGEDPVEYINKYSGRIKLLHLKDYYKNGGMFEFRPIGHGTLDFKMITEAAEKNGVEWLIVEQDDPSMGKTRLECAKMSIDHIKTL